MAALWPIPSLAMTVTDSGFDQVAKIVSLGGTVTQIAGGAPGANLLSAGDFVPPVNNLSGVLVTLPNHQFLDSILGFNDGGSAEPGNFANLILGAPTDITFTVPGSGGPDGTIGDGSIEILAGGFMSGAFLNPIIAPFGTTADILIFSNTSGGGMAQIDLLDPTLSFVVGTIMATIPTGAQGSGVAGLQLDVTDGLSYGGIVIYGNSGAIEIDAIAAIPEPGTALLVGLGLAGMSLAARRRA